MRVGGWVEGERRRAKFFLKFSLSHITGQSLLFTTIIIIIPVQQYNASTLKTPADTSIFLGPVIVTYMQDCTPLGLLKTRCCPLMLLRFCELKTASELNQGVLKDFDDVQAD